MKTRFISLAVFLSLFLISCNKSDNGIQPVDFIHVNITDNFWRPRIDTNVKVTIPFAIRKCENEGRLDNFRIAAGLKEGKWRGTYGFDDSDVYKVLEGMAFTYNVNHDSTLLKQMDEMISDIGHAQCDDGYLYTAYQLKAKDNGPVTCSYNEERYDNLNASHEFYNMGHMYEAAAAHFIATGQRNFLDIAIKSANHINDLFGPGKKEAIPGHQEIEIGLLKLAKVTGDTTYAVLAKTFLDRRGTGLNGGSGYSQNDELVINQKYARGHSVRANYMYTAITDVAILLQDTSYMKAIDTLWNDVFSNKMYITGGLGACYDGERYGDAYALPNASYCETCAAIAGVYWNERMFLLHGQSKYIDILERILYNGLISGISIDGTHFFYTNPMIADGVGKFNHGNLGRFEWFRCSCCPSNDVRFISSIPGYIYATSGNSIYENLYMTSDANIDLNGKSIKLSQKTDYPWDGKICTIIELQKPTEFDLNLRIPLWSQGKPVPTDLYSYIDNESESVTISVNGSSIPLNVNENGYASINRKWNNGDVVEINLPMPVREVVANEKVKADSGLVAIERGPIVYCFEEIDNGQIVKATGSEEATSANNAEILITNTGKFSPVFDSNLFGGITKLTDGQLTAIPYCMWNNRGNGQMTIWMKR